MKSTPLKHKTRLAARTPLKRSKIDSKATKPPKKTSRRKIKNKGYKPPSWFTSIKPGLHGNTPAQKRYWRLVSIAVRVEDYERYGRCVGCSRTFAHWSEAQAGHFKAWSVSYGFFKFERKNLAAICSFCNHISDGPINANFLYEMQRRHGENFKEWIERENLKHKDEKMEVWEIVERAQPLYEKYSMYL